MIPLENRILHLDSTGSLCKFSVPGIELGPIMNYVMKVKNSADLSLPGLVINEMITTGQDTFSIRLMISTFMKNVFKFHSSGTKLFPLVVCDMSWSTVHACLKEFNGQNIFEYMDIVFAYSRDKTITISKTLVGSCASHTMQRFIEKLKKRCAFTNCDCKSLAYFHSRCFSTVLI